MNHGRFSLRRHNIYCLRGYTVVTSGYNGSKGEHRDTILRISWWWRHQGSPMDSSNPWIQLKKWSYPYQCHQDSFLTLALDGGKWSASRPNRFTDRKERRYQFNNKTGWPLRQSGRFGESNKFLVPTAIRTPDLPAHTLVTIPTTLPRLPHHLHVSRKISKKSEHFSQINENQIKLGDASHESLAGSLLAFIIKFKYAKIKRIQWTSAGG
jgi:hypothetical protein